MSYNIWPSYYVDTGIEVVYNPKLDEFLLYHYERWVFEGEVMSDEGLVSYTIPCSPDLFFLDKDLIRLGKL